MKIIVTLLLGISIGGGSAWWFLHQREAPGEAAPKIAVAASAQEAPSGLVKLDSAKQTSAGIVVGSPVARELPREVKGYGRVLDPTPLMISLVDLDSAGAALEASKKEYERVKALFARDQNASARTLDSAEAALKRDQAQFEGARAKVISTWGQPLIDRKDFRTLAQSLLNHESVLVRVDLPISEALFSPPAGARLVSLASEERSAEAEFIGFATAADPQVQGQGLLFLLRENPLGLRPDMAVIGYLKTSKESVRGLVVPRGAVLRSDEQTWVFVQQDETTFRRKPVELERPVEDGWFIATGLEPSDRIVTGGAQVLLSEQSKSRFRIAD